MELRGRAARETMADGGGPRRMQAVVLWEPGGALTVEEVELAPPGPGEVEVAVQAAGVCGSDLHQVLGEYRLPAPCVLGHEGAGVVARVGPGASRVRRGDPVVFLWRSPCGSCRLCREGRPALCVRAVDARRRGLLPDGTSRLAIRGRPIHHFLGVSCWAEYAVVPESGVVRIPEGVPWEEAALVGCAVVTGVGAVWHAGRVRAGDAVAVFGVGGVGLNVVQAAALAGAHPVVAVDVRPSQEAPSRALGATHFVCSAARDPVAAVHDLTGGGADVAFEVVGQPELQAQAVRATRPGGTTVLVGVAPVGSALSLDPVVLVQEDRTIRGSIYGSGRPDRDIPRILELARAGRLRLEPLVTARRPLREAPQAVEDLRQGRGVRTVLQVSAPW